MLKFLKDKNIIELIDLASQAKIPQIEYLSKQEILDELEEDFYNAWDEAIIENDYREFEEFELLMKYKDKKELKDGLPYQGQRDTQEWMVKE